MVEGVRDHGGEKPMSYSVRMEDDSLKLKKRQEVRVRRSIVRALLASL